MSGMVGWIDSRKWPTKHSLDLDQKSILYIDIEPTLSCPPIECIGIVPTVPPASINSPSMPHPMTLVQPGPSVLLSKPTKPVYSHGAMMDTMPFSPRQASALPASLDPGKTRVWSLGIVKCAHLAPAMRLTSNWPRLIITTVFALMDLSSILLPMLRIVVTGVRPMRIALGTAHRFLVLQHLVAWWRFPRHTYCMCNA